ncbi:MAG: proline dehydrogenase family protein [Ignavibacteria bacterium]|nr:proline dehydrogenase family protein [Ignavibacteria bacterium]MDH7528772.1 proline dehydrogenase family protein [Ignavibacteria bacterium]
MRFLNSAIIKLVELFPKSFIYLFASRYIAGERLEDAVELVRELNSKNILATMDVLGEDTTNVEEANVAVEEAIKVLETINKEKLNSTLSIKLTQIGLKLDYNLCLENMKRILTKARELNNYIEIDMEDSSCTVDTINLFKQLRKEFSNCGMVMQAYLRKGEEYLKNTIDYLRGSSVRLCKGIYNEPPEIAFKGKQEIRDNYLKLLDYLFKENIYVGIATHDIKLINGAKELIKKYNKTNNDFEFQMLLGVKVDLRDKLSQEGFKVRVYVPYGTHWYRYSIRRMKENPELPIAIIKNIFAKRG